nr:hypothetical protein [Lachnospiraceae bacterium]
MALLYLVSVEALFPAHAFAMEGEQEVTDIYAWDDGGSNSTSDQDQAAVRDSAPEVQYDQTAALDTQAENTFDTGAAAAGAETSAAEDAAKLYRYPGEVSEQYSVTLHVDDDITAKDGFTGYTRTGNDEYSAVFNVNDIAILPDALSKPGYEFAGWYDSDTGRFHEGTFQSYGKKTLTAIFNPYVVTVRYVKNAPPGSVIGGTVPSARSYAYNSENPPVPTDYCFAGTEEGSTHEFIGLYS